MQKIDCTPARSRFQFHAGVSSETGFNWGFLLPSEMGEVSSYAFNLNVAPGKIMTVSQVLGKCGDNTVHTKLIKTSGI